MAWGRERERERMSFNWTHVDIVKTIPLRIEIVFDSVDRAVQSDAPNEQNGEQEVGKDCGHPHCLQGWNRLEKDANG